MLVAKMLMEIIEKKKGTKHTAIERSKTFEGIARAMAEQWAGKNV